jgi:hypothetical protein
MFSPNNVFAQEKDTTLHMEGIGEKVGKKKGVTTTYKVTEAHTSDATSIMKATMVIIHNPTIIEGNILTPCVFTYQKDNEPLFYQVTYYIEIKPPTEEQEEEEKISQICKGTNEDGSSVIEIIVYEYGKIVWFVHLFEEK